MLRILNGLLVVTVVTASTTWSDGWQTYTTRAMLRPEQMKELVPDDAVRGIVAAFKQHPVVIIGESPHWLRQAGDFYIRLVRDPSFQATVQDIVIEFASRNSQTLIDRYIGGENLASEEVRHIWRDTTKVASWESPIYAEWLASIRDVNQKLPPGRRLRVLAGDTAVDWSRLKVHSDWAALGDNNVSFAEVIVHQVLDKGHRALVVLGSNHVTKSGDRNGADNSTTRVESRYPGSTYVVLLLYGRALASTVEDQLNLPKRTEPALYDIRGTVGGALKADPNGQPLIKRTDALLYLVPREGFTQAVYPPESFDYAYVREVERRSMIEWGELRAKDIFSSSTEERPDAPWSAGVASPRIEMLRQQVERGDSSAVRRFWEEMKTRGTPLIEAIAAEPGRSLATFVYRGNESTKSVALYAQLSNKNDLSGNDLTNLSATDVWYKTYSIRRDMRLGYSLVPSATNGSSASDPVSQIADPLNPKVAPRLQWMGQSVLELPAAPPQPWITARPGVPKGKLVEEHIESNILKSERRAWIYTPAGYEPKRAAPYPILICFDGWIYSRQELIPTPTILDNLIAAGKIPPMMAVFVDQAQQPQRNIELGNNEPFLTFVTDELLPRVRQKWHATSNPRQTIVCGSSSGGLASAFFAFRRPDVYGNVLSQSGAFWPGHVREDPEREWLTRQYGSSPRLPVRLVLQVGILETGKTPNNGPSILSCNRHLRDVLHAKGYELYYSERAGGHEPLNWRGDISEGLIQLIGAESR
jgi:enterochelin esterase-like enzyme